MITKIQKKQACFLPTAFRPTGANPVIRLGCDNEGGHVVATDAVANSRHLLSAGLGRNCEFELDFAAMAPLTSLACYDADIDEKRLRNDRMRAHVANVVFRSPNHRKAIEMHRNYRALFGGQNPGYRHFVGTIGIDEGNTRLADAIAALDPAPGSVFLKCDFKGAEYGMLDQIIELNHLLSGLVLLLHDVPLHMRETIVFLSAMAEFMTLDNTTASNAGGMSPNGVPNVLEISMSSIEHAGPGIPIAGATKHYEQMNMAYDPQQIDYQIFYVD